MHTARSTEDPQANIDWCVRCGVRHYSEKPCPLVAQASGSEAKAWQGVFKGNDGELTVLVLLASFEIGWRARIMTAPGAMWVVPRTSVTMKFLSATPDGARDRAVAYLSGALLQAGFRSLDSSSIRVDRREEKTERREENTDLPDPDVAERKLYRLSARWGLARPEKPADTGNLSANGMFLVTDTPPEPGATVTVRLDMESCSMPLRGRVIWNRPASSDGRPPGMGISLIRPPALYREFVARLTP